MIQLKLTREQVERQIESWTRQAKFWPKEIPAQASSPLDILVDLRALFDENVALKAALAEAPCQKPVTCCSLKLCRAFHNSPTGMRVNGTTHWHVECPQQKDKPHTDWCLRCQCKYPEGKDG